MLLRLSLAVTAAAAAAAWATDTITAAAAAVTAAAAAAADVTGRDCIVTYYRSIVYQLRAAAGGSSSIPKYAIQASDVYNGYSSSTLELSS